MPPEPSRAPSAIPPRTSSAGTGATQSPKAPSKSQIEADGVPLKKKSRVHSMSFGGARPDLGGDVADDQLRQKSSTWSSEKEKVCSNATYCLTWPQPHTVQILFGPFDYLFAHPGKDIRSQLITAFNKWLKVPRESLDIITKVVGMLHTASLLIDDVEDSSYLRRGIPVAHSIFGTAQTLNSSNYVYFVALRELQKLNNPQAITIYTEEMLNLHRGQGMDLFWRDTLTCPTEDDYLEMVGNKTGGLFRLAVKLMQVESQSDKDCVPLVNVIGLLFQIRDDYMNLSSTQYTQNKGLCEDLTEGKFSFPVIHSIRSNPANLQLINILKQRSNDDEVKRYAVSYMEGTGSFEYCRKVVRTLMGRAKHLVHLMDGDRGEGVGVLAFLDKMSME
ncbi:MAG: geranylgeranyl pyrophosphate synthetase [Thelocarpon superellum]|nr:MAG: geranylgeranyl pyrophosphate synthetase [Thelocarpon superellum]